jgi:peptide/nickel transport system permease protein
MGVLNYFARRTVSVVVTVILVIALNFLIIHMAPGNPVDIMGGLQSPSPQQVAYLERYYGLNQPLFIQFFKYVGGLLHGNFGMSISYNQPVITVVAEHIWATLLLTLTAAVLAFVVGAFLGTFTAARANGRLDIALSVVTYVLYAMPVFWLGLLLILTFSSWLQILPVSGMTSLRETFTGFALVLDVMQHMVLPVSALALVQIPVYYRIAKASMSEVLHEDYITTLRATGMHTNRVMLRYALKNAILPTVTIFGLSLGYVITGAALVEIVFGWPGIGQLTLNAVFARDYTLLMGIYIMTSISIAIMILITDVAYAILDPRIRYR